MEKFNSDPIHCLDCYCVNTKSKEKDSVDYCCDYDIFW